MKNTNPGALDLRGQLDGRTLFVMSQVAGLWAELLLLYETAALRKQLKADRG